MEQMKWRNALMADAWIVAHLIEEAECMMLCLKRCVDRNGAIITVHSTLQKSTMTRSSFHTMTIFLPF